MHVNSLAPHGVSDEQIAGVIGNSNIEGVDFGLGNYIRPAVDACIKIGGKVGLNIQPVEFGDARYAGYDEVLTYDGDVPSSLLIQSKMRGSAVHIGFLVRQTLSADEIQLLKATLQPQGKVFVPISCPNGVGGDLSLDPTQLDVLPRGPILGLMHTASKFGAEVFSLCEVMRDGEIYYRTNNNELPPEIVRITELYKEHADRWGDVPDLAVVKRLPEARFLGRGEFPCVTRAPFGSAKISKMHITVEGEAYTLRFVEKHENGSLSFTISWDESIICAFGLSRKRYENECHVIRSCGSPLSTTFNWDHVDDHLGFRFIPGSESR